MSKIVVTVKPVPDTTAPKHIDPQTKRLQRSAATVLNPFDEFAIEAALRLRDADPSHSITVVAMAPESARDAFRKALGMGVDAAVLISDPGLANADANTTARVLRAAIRKLEADLVISGTIASDSSGAYLPRLIAQGLAWPAILGARSLTLAGGRVQAERVSDGLQESLAVATPALVSITREIGAVRYPSLKGIMAAKSKPITVWDLAALELSTADLHAAWSLRAVTPRPPRAAAKIITPPSAQDAAREILQFLHERKAI